MDKNIIGKPRVYLVNKEVKIQPEQLVKRGEIVASIDWVVREGIFDPNGKITKIQPPKRSESFVRAFLELMYIMFGGIFDYSGYPIKDTSGTTVDTGRNTYTWRCTGAIGSVLSGIIVGTGITAPTVEDYVIETLISHGTGAGQLQYGAVTFGAPASDSTTTQFTITRNFANGSGASITVNEVALYVEMSKGGTPTLYYCMTLHDVIGGGVAVPNGQTLTVNYRPQAVI